MKPNKLTNFLEGVQQSASKYSPQILMGIGIAGAITATVLAVKATPKAMKLIEEKKEEEGVEQLTVADTVKTTWKCYIPSAVASVTSTACLIGSCTVSTRRAALYAAAYKVSETALNEYKVAMHDYKESVIETVGIENNRKINENFTKKQSNSRPIESNTVFVTDSTHRYKCREIQTGREFMISYLEIKTAEVNLRNKILNVDGYASVNDMYDELDLDHTDVGFELGWNKYDTGAPILSVSSEITKTGELIYILEYDTPIRDFDC